MPAREHALRDDLTTAISWAFIAYMHEIMTSGTVPVPAGHLPITCGTLALSRAQCRLSFQSAAARFGRVAVERLSPVLQAPFAYEPWSRATLLTLPL